MLATIASDMFAVFLGMDSVAVHRIKLIWHGKRGINPSSTGHDRSTR
jgi:hypothetical protein